jgi:hypothetical protein
MRRSPSDRPAGENPGVAFAQEAAVDARVEHAVRAAVAARRQELELLVEARVDAELEQLASEAVARRLTRPDETCSVCGVEPRLPSRTLCRPCLRVRNRELHAARVARRRIGDAAADDDEEPAPVSARDEQPEQARARTSGGANGAGRAGERLGSPEIRREPAARMSGCREPEHVEERGVGIAADELARRAGGALRADDLETWLRDAGLAQVTRAGLLVPTERGVEIANTLAS